MSLAMTELPFAARRPDLSDRRVVVLGLGRSGAAAAKFCLDRGAVVTATDSRTADSVGETAARLASLGVRMELGGHPEHLLVGCDLIVVSPGVPRSIPFLSEAARRGVPLWGEIELAWRFCRGRVVGITGSNGKSTVTSMVGAILRRARIRGGTGGNLFTPFLELLAEDGPGAVHAVELSSFQLESVETLDCAVAAVLNLTPDHLDRYAGVDDYAAAKARLLELQGADGAAIVNADDEPWGERFAAVARGRVHAFSVERDVERGAFVRDGKLVLRTETWGEETVLDLARLQLPGRHNRANAAAAALAARLAGCAPDPIAAALADFRALPHRLERVATIAGVDWFNDSKATNPDSTLRALESFAPGTVHLILGGKDKGVDWASLAEPVAAAARRVYAVGQAAEAVERALAPHLPVERSGTIAEAARSAAAQAAPGETVLLAPACASFDQYANFEARGEDFRRVVRALAAEGDRPGPDPSGKGGGDA